MFKIHVGADSTLMLKLFTSFSSKKIIPKTKLWKKIMFEKQNCGLLIYLL